MYVKRTRELKLEVIELYKSGTATATEIEKLYGLGHSTVMNWVTNEEKIRNGIGGYYTCTPDEKKKEIAQELHEGVPVAVIMRKHQVTHNNIYKWYKEIYGISFSHTTRASRKKIDIILKKAGIDKPEDKMTRQEVAKKERIESIVKINNGDTDAIIDELESKALGPIKSNYLNTLEDQIEDIVSRLKVLEEQRRQINRDIDEMYANKKDLTIARHAIMKAYGLRDEVKFNA